MGVNVYIHRGAPAGSYMGVYIYVHAIGAFAEANYKPRRGPGQFLEYFY